MVGAPAYLDHAATTPVDPRVREAMLPYLSELYGNPSSIHRWGQQAEAAVEAARRKTAEVLGCDPQEVLFTSGGSESDNLALRGAAWARRRRSGASRILTTPVEHHAVLRTAQALAREEGFELELLPVDTHGRLDPAALASRLDAQIALVSVIYANNEIGSVNAIAEIGDLCHQAGVPFHTDAVQAASQLSLGVDQLRVDLMSLGAHKFYGPKGVGALYVRSGTPLIPTQTGGAQEGGLRAGTHNVASIVGLAEALALTKTERERHNPRYTALRDRLIDAVLTQVPDSRLTGHPTHRLPNHASFVFRAVDGNSLLAALDASGFACSSGSACRTGDPEPSDVLLALGLSPEWALGSLRVTVGRGTTAEVIESFAQLLPETIAALRRAAKPPDD